MNIRPLAPPTFRSAPLTFSSISLCLLLLDLRRMSFCFRIVYLSCLFEFAVLPELFHSCRDFALVCVFDVMSAPPLDSKKVLVRGKEYLRSLEFVHFMVLFAVLSGTLKSRQYLLSVRL